MIFPSFSLRPIHRLHDTYYGLMMASDHQAIHVKLPEIAMGKGGRYIQFYLLSYIVYSSFAKAIFFIFTYLAGKSICFQRGG